MTEIREIIKYLSADYFIKQFLTILALSAYGFALFMFARGKMSWKWRYILSFPLGLAAFVVAGLLVLIFGIPFKGLTIVLMMILILLAAGVAGAKGNHHLLDGFDAKLCLLWIVASVVLALLAVSGKISLALTNDSVYYYSTYPKILVYQGGYAESFDTYLTDVGQASAVINCLPFLFGFDTTFGIQHFLNFSFIISFALLIYEKEKEAGTDIKKAAVLTAAFTLFFVTSTPFMVVSKWVLSNVYFMEYAFWLFVFLGKMSEEEFSLDTAVMFFMMFAALAMLRMEGGIISLLIVFAASAFKYSSKRITVNFLLPVFLMEAGYYIRLFSLGVDPLYSFLDWKKAILMVGMIVAAAIYMLCIRDRVLPLLTAHIKIVMIMALLIGNAGLLVINRARYINNLYAFYQNLRQGNGWGIFGIFILIASLWIFADIIKNRLDITYEDTFLAAFVLAIVAVCWARGGMLVVRTSDSGNRVLLEIVPFVVWVLHDKIQRIINK